MTCYPNAKGTEFLCGDLPLTPCEDMSTEPSIIELVRELQSRKCDCEPYEGSCGWCYSVVAAFPRLAEALLIAYEALKDMAESGCSNKYECEGGCGNCYAKQALSKINSL